nr:TPA: NADH dehydrogenase subunit 6 [Holtodrilus truncatus]
MLIIISFIMSSFISIILANTPMMLIINIMISTLSITYFIYSIISPWYSFLLFLIYIGGMLTMFAYMVSLTPNIFIMIGTHLFSFMLIWLIIITKLMIQPSINLISTNLNYQSTFLYTSNFTYPFLIMILILLIIMVVISKMIMVSKGPLRPFMTYV